MKEFIAKLFSSDDAEISALHFVLVLAVLIFSLPVMFISGIAIGYAWSHQWSMLPDFGRTVRDLGETFMLIIGGVGAGWSLQGLGKRLAGGPQAQIGAQPR